MKLQCPQCDGWFVESLPAWGAWVEIFLQGYGGDIQRLSLPAWGAWVEIFVGVKIRKGVTVAPRMGSVG